MEYVTGLEWKKEKLLNSILYFSFPSFSIFLAFSPACFSTQLYISLWFQFFSSLQHTTTSLQFSHSSSESPPYCTSFLSPNLFSTPSYPDFSAFPIPSFSNSSLFSVWFQSLFLMMLYSSFNLLDSFFLDPSILYFFPLLCLSGLTSFSYLVVSKYSILPSIPSRSIFPYTSVKLLHLSALSIFAFDFSLVQFSRSSFLSLSLLSLYLVKPWWVSASSFYVLLPVFFFLSCHPAFLKYMLCCLFFLFTSQACNVWFRLLEERL